MARFIKANQATAARRRVYFHLVDATDGITPETVEAGGQPQISTNGGAWADAGIGVLVAIGNGRYYAELTQAAVATAGDILETRYKSANTAEAVGDQVHVVALDLDYDLVGADGDTLETLSDQLDAAAPTGQYQVTLHVRDALLAPVQGVRVSVFDATNTAFLSEATTNVNGDVVLALDAASYNARLSKAGYSATVPQAFVVTADQTTNLAVTVIGLDPSADPDYCRVQTVQPLRDAAGTVLANYSFNITAVVPAVVQGAQTLARPVVVQTDATGHFTVDLLRNGKVELWAPLAGLKNVERVVPNSASQDFATWA